MHLSYLFPHMDEASKLLEYISITQKWLPTGYHKLSLDPPLVDQVVNSVSPITDPGFPLKIKVKVIELMSSPPDPTLSPKSVKTEVVTLTQSLSCPSLPVESEMKTYEFSIVSLDCSMQGEFFLFQQNPLQVLRSFPFIRVI